MFDKEEFDNALTAYKSIFASKRWEEEKFKWEAVKWFQDNWNIQADDFPDMLKTSLAKTYGLLASANNYPCRMIELYSGKEPERVRSMFIKLYDETEDIIQRINDFKDEAESLHKESEFTGQHYQYENAISTYLWLRFPDKYYIYKYGEAKSVAERLGSNYIIKKGRYSDNLRNFYEMYDELCKELKKDQELVDIFRSQLDKECYPDPELKTLTVDFGFYISRNLIDCQIGEQEIDDDLDADVLNEKHEDWYPKIEEYSPGFTKEKWFELLNDKSIIGPIWGGVLAAFYGAGGAATCTQLAKEYSRDAASIRSTCTQLAKRIHKETNCPLLLGDNGKKRYWPILFQGKNTTDEEGSFIWKLRPELFDALSEFDIMRYQWKVTEETDADDVDVNYWWLNASPKIWSFSSLPVGNEQEYSLYNDNGNKRRIFQNFLDAKEGDYVIGYEAYPVKQIVALSQVSRASNGETIAFRKIEGLTTPIDYSQLKEIPELENMQFLANPNGSLFKLSKSEYTVLMDLIRESNPIGAISNIDPYTEKEFLEEVYMDEPHYKSLVALLENKRNVILQGAPGVGKTFAAVRLAYSRVGNKDKSRIKIVQFHQNY